MDSNTSFNAHDEADENDTLFVFFKKLIKPDLRRTELIVLLCVSICCVGFLLIMNPSSPLFAGPIESNLEIGQVAPKDIVADRDIVYVDNASTKQKLAILENQLTSVFKIDSERTTQSLSALTNFANFFLETKKTIPNPELLADKVINAYPNLFRREDLINFSKTNQIDDLFKLSALIMKDILNSGILIANPLEDTTFSKEKIRLQKEVNGKIQTEELNLSKLSTINSWQKDSQELDIYKKQNAQTQHSVLILLSAFLLPNTFPDDVQNAQNLDEVRKSVEPLVKKIIKGEKIIRKGFVISESDIQKLKALGSIKEVVNSGMIFGSLFFMLLVLISSIIIIGYPLSGSHITKQSFFLLLGFGAFYFIVSIVLARFFNIADNVHFLTILPTGLLVMLVTILISSRVGLLFSIVLAFLLVPVSQMNAQALVFAFFSGLAATISVKDADHRIDLIRAGFFLCLFQVFLSIIISLLSNTELINALLYALYAAFNGFFCGVLALGFLPLFEHALNAPTRFRLIELSDLNVPILKKLLVQAPGTFSHSVMVANLAESACREIGANALLARVGAYYHDIGKIDQSEYFIENQKNYNKHDEIKPRLSATVIRSHVKLGVEKAERLKLPPTVIDIINQHHGSGVIHYFYSEAKKDDDGVKAEDFTYPGTPPETKEAAVVMLADSVEAASRTLKNPTMSRLESFTSEIINDKVKQGQLNNSDLTFCELEKIKNTFVRIIAGHYHTRIEYPKVD